MRAIYRFPPPDSHVSLSAVLEPGPNPQPATPPRTAPGQSNLPQNRGAPTPKPSPTDTPRHHTPPRPRTRPPTPLPDCRATPTAASLRLGAQSPRPSPASSTTHTANRTRHAIFTPRKHIIGATARARYLRKNARSPPQALSAPSSSLRPNPAFAPKAANRPGQCRDAEIATTATQSPAFIPTRRTISTSPNRPGLRLDTETARTLAPTLCFSRCAAICQLETLTEQGINEHCTVFSRR
jgi:hypothetical protein